MAHIASCVASPEDEFMSKSPSPSNLMLSTTPPTSSTDKPFAWRMQPAEQRKYQLFPKDKPLPVLNVVKSVDPETAFEMAMGEKSSIGPNLRLRLNQNHPSRRRKISVPELEPMTTVQEVSMDSPTIPGRPPLHERSASAPDGGRDGKKLPLGMLGDIHLRVGKGFSKSIERAFSPTALRPTTPQSQARQLAPLVIPAADLPRSLEKKSSSSKLRSDSTPSVSSSKHARADNSPLGRPRITPDSSTSDLSFPGSATTDATSIATLPTPVSAPIFDSYRAIPQPWDSVTSLPMTAEIHRKPTPQGHRRGASESSTSIMDRGRPRKRSESRSKNELPELPIKGHESKRLISCERRAFEQLPQGWRPSEAGQNLSSSDVMTLRKQALGQAERFEVLKIDDVESLSKELRRLDERTDYLRRTYTSLRAGRRNLHSRICQYLRSPRVAKFSHDAMLKQEEALAELDASIDDWVTKLEQAENRRMRVRQKLLEHVAAASILPGTLPMSAISESLQQVMGIQSPTGPRELSTPPRSPSQACFGRRSGETSPSPHRVVAQVPVATLEEPVVGKDAENAASLSRADSILTLNRRDVESIRVYAGDDVYALLADVENEISKMGGAYSPTSSLAPAPLSGAEENEDTSERERQRQRSHDKLDGFYCTSPTSITAPSARAPESVENKAHVFTKTSRPKAFKAQGVIAHMIAPSPAANNMTPSPLSPLPVVKNTANSENFLTSAVFKP